MFAELCRVVCVLAAGGALSAAQDTAHSTDQARPDPLVYRIGPGDVLQIEVYKEPDASVQSITVRPDGKISMPMAGEVPVVDLTPAELEKTLSAKLGELIRSARVTVMVREVNSQKIYVIGEVRREGAIRVVGPMTVLQALAEAGGLTDYAKRHRIYILRTGAGRQLVLPFDYNAVVRGQKVDQNVVLHANDTVIVPR